MRARTFTAATVAAAWLATSGALNPASAIPITGQFSIVGNDIYDLSANVIRFIPGTQITAGTGSFSTLLNTTISFNQGQGAFVDYTTLTGLFFSGESGLSFSFTDTASFQEGGLDPTNLAIFGPGTLNLSGFDPTPGTFSLTSQGGGNGTVTVTFSATTRADSVPGPLTPVPVPGPLVGAGIPGLVTACGCLIFLARRRRQHVG